MKTFEIKKIHRNRVKEIKSRLEEFRQLWDGRDDNKILAELVFCLLTPQSKAKTCWSAVCSMKEKGLLKKGRLNQISNEIRNVRFKNKKTEYIHQARKAFKNNGRIGIESKLKEFKSATQAREWLVKNIKGLGFKEASHFLRNIGLGCDMAILDRHILKNLKAFNVIDDIPASLSK